MPATIGILRVELSHSGVRPGNFRGEVELLQGNPPAQPPGVVALLKLREDGWLEIENVRKVFEPEAVNG